MKEELKKVYIAAPLFTEEQINKIKVVEDIIETHGYQVISPRNFGVPSDKEEYTDLSRRLIFNKNREGLVYSDYLAAILGRIDETQDIGTLWELGYFIGSAVIRSSSDLAKSRAINDIALIISPDRDEWVELLKKLLYIASIVCRVNEDYINKTGGALTVMNVFTYNNESDNSVRELEDESVVSINIHRLMNDPQYEKELTPGIPCICIDDRPNALMILLGLLASIDDDYISISTISFKDYDTNIMLKYSIDGHIRLGGSEKECL